MKRRINKALALVLTFALVAGFGMSMNVIAGFADGVTLSGSSTLRIEADESNRTYNLYQVFYGDEASGKLGNVQWGASITTADAESILAYLKAEKLPTDGDSTALNNPFYDTTESEGYFASCSTAADVATVLQALENDETVSSLSDATIAETFATIVNYVLKNSSNTWANGTNYKTRTGNTGTTSGGKYTYGFTNIHDGYYLVTETDTAAGNVASKLMLRIIGDATVEAKDSSSAPTNEKEQVVASTEGGYSSTSDHSVAIGDTVYYKLTSSVIDMSQFSSFTQYFSDTMSGGLTYGNIVSVKVGDTTLEASTGYTVETKANADGTTTLEVKINDMKQYQTAYETAAASETTAKIEVIYSATVNEKATIGTSGIDNTSVVYYSHNPTSPAALTHTLGATEKVYTTGIELLKVGGTDLSSDAGLSGAVFQLEGSELNTVLVSKKTFTPSLTAGADGSLYYKASSGDVYLKTTGNPSGLEDEVNKIYTYTNGAYVQSLGEGTDTYYYKVANEDKYVEISSYSSTETYETWQMTYAMTERNNDPITSGASTYQAEVGTNGYLYLDGLGAGTYTLKEITAPAGIVDKIKDVTIKISYSESSTGEPQWTYSISGDDVTENESSGLVIQETDKSNDGRLYIKVLNKTNTGSLPTTGGIGTTIFYILGSILVLGAAILLIVRRRMRVDKNVKHS